MTELTPRMPDVPQEAEDWVVRLDFAGDSPQELVGLLPLFEQWLEAAPENRLRFAAAQERWETLAELDRTDWDLALASESSSAPAQPSIQSTLFRGRWVAALASVILIVCAVLFYAHFANRPLCHPPMQLTHGQCTLSEGYGASSNNTPLQLVLGDGTRVTLAGELTVSLTAEHRQVVLQSGQAIFSVAKKKAPFWVTAGLTRVKAVGTEFTVRRTSAVISSTRVSDGMVEIFVANQHGLVRTGERGDFDGTTLTVYMSDHARAFLSSSGRQMLQFDGATVTDAVREFNRYNPHDLLIADERIAHHTIGGTFLASDPDTFAGVVDEKLNSKHTISTDSVRGVRLIRLTGALQSKTPVRTRPPSGGTDSLEENSSHPR